MQLQFVGCGDAFGSGGRFNTCFHLQGAGINLLVDCGATSLVALKRLGVDRNAIDAVLVTHFHADHFGGIPFLVLDAQFAKPRARALTIAGPPGLHSRYLHAMEAAFPGSAKMKLRFPLRMVEVAPERETEVAGARVTAFPVVHDDRAGPCLGYRIAVGDRLFAYSGDTEWTDTLIALGREADLFVCEAYTRARKVKLHLDLATLERHLPEIRPRRLMLTHMSDDMLARRGEVAHSCAEDGLIVPL